MRLIHGISSFTYRNYTIMTDGIIKMANTTYKLIEPTTGAPIKAWIKGVTMEDEAKKQLLNVAQLPFVYKWIAVMPL
jgi:hypothetical protein